MTIYTKTSTQELNYRALVKVAKSPIIKLPVDESSKLEQDENRELKLMVEDETVLNQ